MTVVHLFFAQTFLSKTLSLWYFAFIVSTEQVDNKIARWLSDQQEEGNSSVLQNLPEQAREIAKTMILTGIFRVETRAERKIWF